ncbi:MAG: sensor histidine kinase [Treponema sp.]|nr:sensor histidine kinase [Treponema sp.]
MKHKKSRIKPISIQKAQYYIVLLALLPALFIIGLSEGRRARQFEDIVAKEALKQASSVAALQFSITESTRQILATLANLPEFKRLNAELMTPIIKNMHAANEAYLNFTVTDNQGIVVASSRLAPGTSVKGRPHIEAVFKTLEFSPGSYIVGLVENTPSFSYAYPIISDKGELKGAITATYKLSSYESYMNSIEKQNNTVLGIADRYGTRLYFYPSLETNPIGKPIKYEIWNRIQQGADQGVFLDVGSDGFKRYYGYKKLRVSENKDPYMFVVYGIPYSVVTDRVLPILYQELGLIILVMVLAFGITRLLYGPLFGARLRQLVSLTEQIQAGSIKTTELDPDPTPDLGQIQNAILQLMKGLEVQKNARLAYEKELNEALQGKNMLIKEVHHRVKNDFQLILSMVRLQSENSKNIEEFRSAMEGRIASMLLVHQMLYETENQEYINLGIYGQKIMELVISLKDVLKPINIDIQTDEIHAPLDKTITFGLLLNELVTNSLKHGIPKDKDPCFTLILKKQDQFVSLHYKDNGPGLPDNFSITTSKGLGMQLAIALAEQLGGNLRWDNCGGACFYVVFPLGAKAETTLVLTDNS